jgi:hypothetical protein
LSFVNITSAADALHDGRGEAGDAISRQGDTCESWDGPTRSETLHTPGSFLHRSWEISAVPGETTPGGPGKAKCRTPGQPTAEKSDALVVPGKPSNKGNQPAEMVEGRSAAKGNAEQDPHPDLR